MNKNWLYRLLALALIAMLALPMVAMAEEVEEVNAFLTADGAVDEQEGAVLGNNGVEDNAVVIDWDYDDYAEDVVDVDFDTKKYTVDDAFDMSKTDGFLLRVDVPSDYDFATGWSFKSSKTKVADVAGIYTSETGGAQALVVLKDVGKCTVTVKAKLGKWGHNKVKYKTKTIKVSFTVKDALSVDSVKTYWGSFEYPDTIDDGDCKKSGHNYGKVVMGKYFEDPETLSADAKALLPVGFDSNGDANSYLVDPSDNGKVWRWSWSNAKVAFFAPMGGDSVVKKQQQSGLWDDDYTANGGEVLYPVFYKPGTTTVTFKSYNGKKATAKFTVKKKTKSWTVKKSDGDPDGFVIRVKKVDFTDMDHATITFVAINNTGSTFKDKKLPFEIEARIKGVPTIVFAGEKKFDVEVKPGKMKTFTMKLSNKRDSEFALDGDAEILDVSSDIDNWGQPVVIFGDDWEPDAPLEPAYGKDAE